MKKVRIDKTLWERARRCAEEAGYASVDDLVAHAVERAVIEIEKGAPAQDEALERRLSGLGYIE